MTTSNMACDSTFIYDVYGLTLMSDIRLTLPEARFGHCGEGELVRIESVGAEAMPSVSDEDFDPDPWFHHRILSGGALYLCWRDWFDLIVPTGGATVLCRNLSDRSLEFFDAYLTNFSVSAALIQRGEESLHATAIDIGGRAIGLLGACGAGKSTLAAFLKARGGDIITDDMLRLTMDGDTILAHPGPHRLKLFEEAAKLFLPQAAISGRWSPVGDKFIYDLDDSIKSRSTTRLAALYYLQAPDQPHDGAVVLDRLSGLDLFRTISASTMINALDKPGRPEHHFHFINGFVNRVPVYRLTYPRSFDVFDEVADKIFDSAPS
ncbi:MAG: hypothetical protein AB7U61_05845 [Methylocystis sp.]